MGRSFQELMVENLAGFGIEAVYEDIPDFQVATATLNGVTNLTNTVSDQMWAVLRHCDLADGFWYEGYFENWTALYTMLKANASGSFVDTKRNIGVCVTHSQQQLADEPPGLPDGGINDVVGGDTDAAYSNP